jgi:hypothetical protein
MFDSFGFPDSGLLKTESGGPDGDQEKPHGRGLKGDAGAVHRASPKTNSAVKPDDAAKGSESQERATRFMARVS